MEIFRTIHKKFSENFELSIDKEDALLNEAEVKSKFIYHIGEQLRKSTTSQTKLEVVEIFNELFSDTTVALYLSTCAISHSSNIMMRRVLELGIAILYFWDMPHKYWGWKNNSSYENDLSFKDNIEFLNSQTYSMYLEMDCGIKNWECDKEEINKYYRKLSNTIHGRYETFATASTDSFNFVQKDYKRDLNTIIGIENILLDCFKRRFKQEFENAVENVPAITRYNYGN